MESWTMVFGRRIRPRWLRGLWWFLVPHIYCNGGGYTTCAGSPKRSCWCSFAFGWLRVDWLTWTRSMTPGEYERFMGPDDADEFPPSPSQVSILEACRRGELPALGRPLSADERGVGILGNCSICGASRTCKHCKARIMLKPEKSR